MIAMRQVARDLLFPSRFPELADYPNLRKLLAEQVDMQMDDVASMLALPRWDLGLTGGCNLALTGLLSNVISGCSVLLFEASLDSVWGGARADSGTRFKALLLEYYPWREDDGLTPERAAHLLYHEARNPLAHDLGVGKNRIAFPGLPVGDRRAVMLAKGALTVDEIESLLRPDGERPLFATIRLESNAWVVDVEALAWGTFVVLHRLLADSYQADLAEETAQALLTGNMIDYGALVPGEHCPSDWGQIRTIEEYENLLDQQVLIVRVPRVVERRRPAVVHDGACRDLQPDRVAQHLLDGQAGRYFWARDLGVARQVFRARRCFSQHDGPGPRTV